MPRFLQQIIAFDLKRLCIWKMSIRHFPNTQANKTFKKNIDIQSGESKAMIKIKIKIKIRW